MQFLLALSEDEATTYWCCGSFVALFVFAAIKSQYDKRRLKLIAQAEAEKARAWAAAQAESEAKKAEAEAEAAAENARLAAIPRRCPYDNCGYQNNPGAQFCGQCGRPIGTVS